MVRSIMPERDFCDFRFLWSEELRGAFADADREAFGPLRRIVDALFPQIGGVALARFRLDRAARRRGDGTPLAAIRIAAAGRRPAAVLVAQTGTLRWITVPRVGDGEPPAAIVVPFPVLRSGTGEGLAGLADRLEPDIEIAVFDAARLAAITPRGAERSSSPVLEELGAPGPGERRGGRTLVLLHDVLSGCGSGFDALVTGGRPAGRLGDGSRILGFDHQTLMRSPAENAEDLDRLIRDEIGSRNDRAGGEIDLLALGRGGLVARHLIEDPRFVAGRRQAGLRIRSATLVGVPADGTSFARPDRFADFLDLRTTLLARAAGFFGAAAARGGGSAGATADLGRIGPVIAALAGGDDPAVIGRGWFAVADGGAPSAALGEDPGERPILRTIAVDHDPSLSADRTVAPAVLGLASERLLGTRSSDLMVPVASAGGEVAFAGRLADRVVLRSAVAHAGALLADPAVVEMLAGRLGRDPGFSIPSQPVRRPSPQEAPLDPSPRRRTAMRRDVAGSIAGSTRSRSDDAAPSSPAERSGAAETDGAIDLMVEATMPDRPPVGLPVALELSLERSDPVSTTDDLAHRTVETRETAELTLSVSALDNGRVLGPGPVVARPPAAHRRDSWIFSVVCEASGPARFAAEVWQGPVRLWLGRLEVVAGDGGGTGRTIAAASIGSAAVDADGLVTLRVSDRRGAGGDTELAYTVTGLGANLEDTVGLDGRSFDRFVENSLLRLERAFVDVPSTAVLEERVRALGLYMADTLLPVSVRDLLWRERGRIEAIQIVSDAQRIPWEVVVVDDPRSDEPGFFLADRGLVRWFRRVGFPAARRRTTLGPVVWVKPDLGNPDWELPFTDLEIEAIDDLIGPMRRWPAWSSEILGRLRRRPQIGVFHFSGHGDVEASRVGVAEGHLVLGDRWDAESRRWVVGDILDSRLVASAFRAAPGSAPIVFLNACRAGRATRALTGIAGYARAFVAPRSGDGAGVFVGAAWSVEDAAAATFATTFYRRLAAGDPLHRAVTAARAEARRYSSGLTWLAYSVYGDPIARFDFAAEA